MKHSFAMSNFFFDKSADEVIDWALANAFDGIELWADVPYMFVDSVDNALLDRLKQTSNRLEYSIHSPLYDSNICSVNPGIRKESLRQILKIKEWADFFPIKYLIIHLGKIPSRDSKVLDICRGLLFENIETIVDHFANTAEILIENIGFRAIDYDLEIDRFVNTVKELGLGLCYDTGHANIDWQIEKSLPGLKGMLRQMHISDNYAKTDEHLAAGSGKINWSYIIDQLGEDIDNIRLVHEIHNSGNPELDTLRSRKIFSEFANVPRGTI